MRKQKTNVILFMQEKKRDAGKMRKEITEERLQRNIQQ